MDITNLLADRLKFLMKIKGYTITDLAIKANVSEDTIKSIRSCKTKNPSIGVIAAISAALDCSIENLIGRTNSYDNEAELLRKWRSLDTHGRNSVMLVLDKELALQPSYTSNTRLLKCYTPSAYLGNGALYDENRFEYISIPFDYMKNANFAMTVLSDSLFPMYFPGDMIALEKRFPLPDEIALYIKDNIIYFRKHSVMNSKVRLIPPFATNNEVELKNIDSYTCLGTVIGVIRQPL